MALIFLAVAPLVLHSTTGRGAAVHGRSESPPSAQSDPAGGAIVARLSTSAITTLLRQKGYTHIGKVRLTGGAYTVLARDRHGRRVKLIVDPSSGRILRVSVRR